MRWSRHLTIIPYVTVFRSTTEYITIWHCNVQVTSGHTSKVDPLLPIVFASLLADAVCGISEESVEPFWWVAWSVSSLSSMPLKMGVTVFGADSFQFKTELFSKSPRRSTSRFLRTFSLNFLFRNILGRRAWFTLCVDLTKIPRSFLAGCVLLATSGTSSGTCWNTPGKIEQRSDQGIGYNSGTT